MAEIYKTEMKGPKYAWGAGPWAYCGTSEHLRPGLNCGVLTVWYHKNEAHGPHRSHEKSVQII